MNIDKIIKVKTARWIARRYLRKRIKGLKQIKNKIVLLNVPSHGNLGDHLISLAEQTLLKDITGEYPIVFTSGELYYGLDLIESYIQRHHTVLITGGGYLGSIWPEEEIRVQNIVKNIKDNKIIILPQTIFYEDTEDSEILIRETSRIFSYHNNLKIFTREKASYKVLTETLKLNDDKIGLLPDMGLYLNLCSNQERNGILYCLRKDKEQIDNYDIICDLKRLLGTTKKIEYIDTQVPYTISQKEEQPEIYKFVKKFQTAELVITDRLHGMIFATITGTPVIALDNSSHKIKNVYNSWLKEIPYIKFIEESNVKADELATLLNEVEKYKYDEYWDSFKKNLESIKQFL